MNSLVLFLFTATIGWCVGTLAATIKYGGFQIVQLTYKEEDGEWYDLPPIPYHPTRVWKWFAILVEDTSDCVSWREL